LETHELIPHPDHPPLDVSRIEARITSVDQNWLNLHWRIDDAVRLVLPPFAGKGRADGLWNTTCFELFLRTPGDDGYVEINLSPSERWAAYDFIGYRQDMAKRKLAREPVCTMRIGQSIAVFDAAVPLAGLPRRPWEVGLSAVIEETGGTKSYWALAHPPGEPDFHAPACFALTLPAPEAP
jgi:hypothetical protein